MQVRASAVYDVTTIGELVIDLIPVKSPDKALHFAARPGGAPGNVAVGTARLGLRTAMLSKVGREAFGASILATLRENGVVTKGVRASNDRMTGLAVVTIAPDGDRDFLFYRDACADLTYAPAELARDILVSTRVLHVGSLFLGHPISAAAQRRALDVARRAGALISADPNFRPMLWRDRAAMLAAGREIIEAADIVKVGEAELAELTGIANIEVAARSLWHSRLKVLAVTKGAGGAEIFTAAAKTCSEGFAVKAIDTVGCGDAFMATLLAECLAANFDAADVTSLASVARRACAAGALTATKPGGMESLPTAAEIEAFLAEDRAQQAALGRAPS
jgi:fructokinase